MMEWGSDGGVNGLLSPALSSKGGEGEDCAATWEDYDYDYDYEIEPDSAF